MKKVYLFKEEEYKDTLKELNFFCEVINQHWEGLNSARPIKDEDLPYIGKLWTHFYDKLWNPFMGLILLPWVGLFISLLRFVIAVLLSYTCTFIQYYSIL